jgi:hypothetical protein
MGFYFKKNLFIYFQVVKAVILRKSSDEGSLLKKFKEGFHGVQKPRL